MKKVIILFVHLCLLVFFLSSCDFRDLNITQTSGTYICEKCDPPVSLHFINDNSLEIINMRTNVTQKFFYYQEGQMIIVKDSIRARAQEKLFFIGRVGKNGKVTSWDLKGRGHTFSKHN